MDVLVIVIPISNLFNNRFREKIGKPGYLIEFFEILYSWLWYVV